jgi:hypothetical protein
LAGETISLSTKDAKCRSAINRRILHSKLLKKGLRKVVGTPNANDISNLTNTPVPETPLPSSIARSNHHTPDPLQNFHPEYADQSPSIQFLAHPASFETSRVDDESNKENDPSVLRNWQLASRDLKPAPPGPSQSLKPAPLRPTLETQQTPNENRDPAFFENITTPSTRQTSTLETDGNLDNNNNNKHAYLGVQTPPVLSGSKPSDPSHRVTFGGLSSFDDNDPLLVAGQTDSSTIAKDDIIGYGGDDLAKKLLMRADDIILEDGTEMDLDELDDDVDNISDLDDLDDGVDNTISDESLPSLNIVLETVEEEDCSQTKHVFEDAEELFPILLVY